MNQLDLVLLGTLVAMQQVCAQGARWERCGCGAKRYGLCRNIRAFGEKNQGGYYSDHGEGFNGITLCQLPVKIDIKIYIYLYIFFLAY